VKAPFCIVSSSRADYNFLHSIVHSFKKTELESSFTILISEDELNKHSRIEETTSDGLTPDCIIPYPNPSSESEVGQTIAHIVKSMGDLFEEKRPKALIIFGDRIEILVTAFIAFVLNIDVIHIAGGEVSLGSKDDKYRKMISVLAKLHFPISKSGAEQLLNSGVNSESLFYIGDPSQDNIKALIETAPEELAKTYLKYGIKPGDSFVIFTFHPTSMKSDYGFAELTELLEALHVFLKEKAFRLIITGRNADFAPECFDELLEQFRLKNQEQVIYTPNLGRRDYIFLLSMARLMVGNSSSAFYEASYLGVPSLSIGDRQLGRSHSDSVKFIPAQKIMIEEAVREALDTYPHRTRTKLVGGVGEKIVKKIIETYGD
jgi:UDP-hydrolysing UDP-N-acetyl-D-glucosamine 2-epimerase